MRRGSTVTISTGSRNVGAVFRSAAALGIDAVLLSPRCANPLYRRSVKVAMGAVFSVPYARLEDWHDGIGQVSRAGFTTIALTPRTPWTSRRPCVAWTESRC